MKQYYVYRYQEPYMKNPAWNATNTKRGIDCLPCCVLANPGILIIEANNKKDAIRIAKSQWNIS
jgi:hypothetical protein